MYVFFEMYESGPFPYYLEHLDLRSSFENFAFRQ